MAYVPKPTSAARPPQLPPETRESARAATERQAEAEQRTAKETVLIVQGLLWLGVVVLVASMLRAGLGRVFVHGWWSAW